MTARRRHPRQAASTRMSGSTYVDLLAERLLAEGKSATIAA
jgi:hypothetical protein